MELTSDQIAGIRQLSGKLFYGPIETIPGSTIYDLLDTFDAKEKRIGELEEALGFYADSRNWVAGQSYATKGDQGNHWLWVCVTSISDDRGERARKVLGEKL